MSLGTWSWWILVPGGSAPALMMMSQSNLDPSFPSIPSITPCHTTSKVCYQRCHREIYANSCSWESPGPSESLPDHHCDIHGSRPPWGKALYNSRSGQADRRASVSQRALKDSVLTTTMCCLLLFACFVFSANLVFFQQGQVVSHKFYTNHLFRFIKQRKSEKLFMHLLVGHLWVAFHHRFLIRFMHLCMAWG